MKRMISILFLLASFVTLFSANISAEQIHTEVIICSDGSVTFHNLDQLKENSISCVVTDLNGNDAVVTLKKLNSDTSTSAANTWEVSYSGLSLDCSFYMTVSNNRVISVYNSNINTHIGSYSNAQLTKTTEDGTLSFVYTWGIYSSSCWLKGTVTGSDNDIAVSHHM